ncbi:MAG: AbrB/MazE/SpoVT family DNA-binding domain-containing protein [Bacillota bacterium]
MGVVSVEKDYQIQIPYDIREKFAISRGDKLILEVDKRGKIIINKFKKSAVDESFGIWTGEKNGIKYVNKMRDEEENRLKEIEIEKGIA